MSSWPEAVFTSVAVAFLFSGTTVAIWQAFRTWQTKVAARVTIARDEAYRDLAARATAAQQATAEEQQKIARELADLRTRVTAIEAMLREVG